MFNKTLFLSKSRIEVYWSLFLLHKFSRPEYTNTDENDLSDDDGLLFEVDDDDTGFDGIFEEQW
jgi:hypothetical protein